MLLSMAQAWLYRKTRLTTRKHHTLITTPCP